VKPFTRVLAAVDFSKPALGAFEYALALSKQHGAELVVVHAVPRNQALSWHAPERRALIAQLRHRANLAHVAFEARVQQGDAAPTILSYARSLHADVIVAGTHQRKGIERFRTASVAERLAASAAVPVLVVPREGHAGPARPFNHVAVAVDFDISSERAIHHAFSVASGPAQRVTLLHVVSGVGSDEPPDQYSLGIVEYQDQLMQDDRKALMHDAGRRLQLAVATQRHRVAAIDTRVACGDVETEVSRAVGSIGADLLIVGVPTRGVVSRALFGTTAARLLRVSAVPMLAVPEASPASSHEASASLQLAS
jgi:nucleotide-binding universal stress UspA family protein